MKVAICFLLCVLAAVGVSTRDVAESFDIENRIVSGINVEPGQLPWQVILRTDVYSDLRGGGSILSRTWVLTAAHVTYGLSSIYMVFGTVLLLDLRAVHMISKQLFIHPQYNDQTLLNDVSLIQLPDALNFSRIIQPVVLPPRSQANDNFLHNTCIIAGFGIADDEYLDYSKYLLYAEVVIMDINQCVTEFRSQYVDTNSHLCGKGANGSKMSICTGDSGGPLLVRDNTTGRFMQIGIGSFVWQDKCTEGLPSVYVRLGAYLDYIERITGILVN